jgi:hypothetical protein
MANTSSGSPETRDRPARRRVCRARSARSRAGGRLAGRDGRRGERVPPIRSTSGTRRPRTGYALRSATGGPRVHSGSGSWDSPPAGIWPCWRPSGQPPGSMSRWTSLCLVMPSPRWKAACGVRCRPHHRAGHGGVRVQTCRYRALPASSVGATEPGTGSLHRGRSVPCGRVGALRLLALARAIADRPASSFSGPAAGRASDLLALRRRGSGGILLLRSRTQPAAIRRRPSSARTGRQRGYVAGPAAFACSSAICLRAAATSSSLVLA